MKEWLIFIINPSSYYNSELEEEDFKSQLHNFELKALIVQQF